MHTNLMNSIPSYAKQGVKRVISASRFYQYVKHLAYRYRIYRDKSLNPNHPETDAINAFISVLEDGDTIWDVGAMGGSYAGYARSAIQPEAIHAFEPNPLHIENCSRTVSDLPGKFKRRVHQTALSDESGSVYFATEMPANANTSAGAIVSESELDKFDSEKIVEVPVKTGDQVIQNGESAPPTVLKIDVEGAEMNVLKGLSETFSSGNIRVVLCEVHLPTKGPSPSLEDFGYSESEVHNFFNDHSFTINKVNVKDRDYHILAKKDEST